MTIQNRVKQIQGIKPNSIFERECGLKEGDLKLFYCGRSNTRIIEVVARYAGIPLEQFVINVDEPAPYDLTKHQLIPKADKAEKAEEPIDAAPAEPISEPATEEQATKEPEPIIYPAQLNGESKRDYAKRLLDAGCSHEKTAELAGYVSVNFLTASLKKAENPSIQKVTEKPINRAPRNQYLRAQPPLEDLCETEVPVNPDYKIKPVVHENAASENENAEPVREIKLLVNVPIDRNIIPVMYRGRRHYYDLRKDPKVVKLFQEDNDDGQFTKAQLLALVDELMELAERMEE